MAEDLITVSVEGGRAPLQVHRSSQQLRAGGEGVRGLTATHGSLVLALLDAGEPLSEAQLVLAMGELRGRAVSGKRIGRWASEINVAVRRTAVRADPLGYPAGGPYRLRLLKPTGDVSGTDAAEALDTALTAGLVAAIREAAAAGEWAI